MALCSSGVPPSPTSVERSTVPVMILACAADGVGNGVGKGVGKGVGNGVGVGAGSGVGTKPVDVSSGSLAPVTLSV